jgi:hypothetical protein
VDTAPGYYNVACFFKDGGDLEGPMGTVRHMSGKKKAREECARLTFKDLQGVKENRMSQARKALDDGGVTSIAVRQPIGGSGEIEAGVVNRAAESSELKTDDEEDFKDAVEVIDADT